MPCSFLLNTFQIYIFVHVNKSDVGINIDFSFTKNKKFKNLKILKNIFFFKKKILVIKNIESV